MRGGIKRVILIAVVIACFVSFDGMMDYLARHAYPALFGFILYPIDIAGAIEYSIAIAVLYMLARKVLNG